MKTNAKVIIQNLLQCIHTSISISMTVDSHSEYPVLGPPEVTPRRQKGEYCPFTASSIA